MKKFQPGKKSSRTRIWMHNMFLEEDISILMFLRLDKSKKKIKIYIYIYNKEIVIWIEQLEDEQVYDQLS
jgi:hypothetical protein